MVMTAVISVQVQPMTVIIITQHDCSCADAGAAHDFITDSVTLNPGAGAAQHE